MSKDKDIKDELKNSLSDLVSNSLASEDSDFPSIDEAPQIAPFDFSDVSAKSKSKAQKTVLSCLKLYFDEKLINKNEFLQAKAAIATSTLTTLFKQLKMAEHMMEKLINDIDSGNMHSRTFEVASGVQHTIIDLLKNTQLHVISMNEDMKRMKSEIPLSEQERDNTIEVKSGSPNTYLNAKSMLKDLEDEDVEDVEEED